MESSTSKIQQKLEFTKFLAPIINKYFDRIILSNDSQAEIKGLTNMLLF